MTILGAWGQNMLEASTLCDTKQDLFIVYLSSYLMLQFAAFVGEKSVLFINCICSELPT